VKPPLATALVAWLTRARHIHNARVEDAGRKSLQLALHRNLANGSDAGRDVLELKVG